MYTYGVIVKKVDVNEYLAQAPDFIECFGSGETFDEAIDDISRVVKIHIGYLLAYKSDLPKRSKLQTDEGEVVYVSVTPNDYTLEAAQDTNKINMFNCPAPTHLKIGENHSLFVAFNDGITKNFDMTPYIENYNVFAPLNDGALFSNAQLDRWGIIWNDEIDIAIEEVYEKGVAVNDNTKRQSVNELI